MREKQIKGYVRSKKIKLINSKNPHWEDIFEKLINGDFMSS